MARKSISWILNFTDKLPKSERLTCLQQNDTTTMRTVLRYAFDPNIKWLLPEGEVPYTPNPEPHQENMLYMEARKLYLFVQGGNDNLKQAKREMLFIGLVQSLDPEDAKLIIAAKDKKLPYKNITKDLVLKAFPGLF